MSRSAPNVLITGTPGTGKTSTAELVCEQTGFKQINVSAFVKERGLYTERDDDYDCLVIDEDKLLDEMEVLLKDGGVVVDFHGSEMFPERWFDLVVVLRSDNSVLYERLEKRGYSQKKLQENVEAEIMQVMLDEAMESYSQDIIQVMQSDTFEELEVNAATITNWIQSTMNAASRQ
eukprot:TRINITY_DN7769_c0_g1_i2.p2 TRINITY_DN7769_c0_g1~~TRINITY_DN7769_c0_g1_i2.p2  ORF type:complete len:176 (-),score=60.40 TRINITY_DN7769_c0_g1_i2:506-1033(-)